MNLNDHVLWRKPVHHLDHKDSNNHVAWIELFYDLIHVVCVFMLGDFLSHHLNMEGILIFCGLFFLIWSAWAHTIYYTSLYVSNDTVHRIIMAAQICTIMIMAASIPSVTGKGAVYFALGYAANQFCTAMMFYRAVKHNQTSTSIAGRASKAYLITGILFVISAFLPAPTIYMVWAVAIFLLQLNYQMPKYGIMSMPRFHPRLEHLSERFALLTLIVIGEGFFKMVVTLGEKGIYKVPPEVFVNCISGGFGLFGLCWLYFDFVGNGEPKENPRAIERWWFGHLFLMISAIMIGVALKAMMKIGFWEPYPNKYALVGCIGLAGFLAALWLIQSGIQHRKAHDYYGAGLRVFGIALALLTYALVDYLPALVGNMMWSVALFSQLVVPVMNYRKHVTENQATDTAEV